MTYLDGLEWGTNLCTRKQVSFSSWAENHISSVIEHKSSLNTGVEWLSRWAPPGEWSLHLNIPSDSRNPGSPKNRITGFGRWPKSSSFSWERLLGCSRGLFSEELQDAFCVCSPCWLSRAENKEGIIKYKRNPGLARRRCSEIHAHLNETVLEMGAFEPKASVS